MQLRLALPKGQLLAETSALLHRSGLEVAGYDEQSRSYRPECRNLPGTFLKVFNEKDIPIQVAVGNYELGICGLDWVAELLAKYPSSALVKVQDLGYGWRHLSMAASRDSGWCDGGASGFTSLEGLGRQPGTIRIATEYPNLAEAFALRRRFRRFAVFPLWGGAEAYPPESADLALIARPPGSPLNHGLACLCDVLHSGACLVAHRPSWESRDLSPLLDRLAAAAGEPPPPATTASPDAWRPEHREAPEDSECVWLALPDGHQQKPALEFLARAGITVADDPRDPRRPRINLERTRVKVIRPQDMPLQVANGNFDLALTGEDWLADHLYQFPGSPVRKLLALPFGRVRIVAVVSKSTPFKSPRDLEAPLRRRDIAALRIASEYINIADRYARDNHLSPCHLIPTWGATEAFLPEDADLLIENTQTGRTLAQHGLRIIDTLFESSACLIGRPPADLVGRPPAGDQGGASTCPPGGAAAAGSRQERISGIVQRLERTLKESH